MAVGVTAVHIDVVFHAVLSGVVVAGAATPVGNQHILSSLLLATNVSLLGKCQSQLGFKLRFEPCADSS